MQSKAYIDTDNLNTEVMGSNPTWGIDVCPHLWNIKQYWLLRNLNCEVVISFCITFELHNIWYPKICFSEIPWSGWKDWWFRNCQQSTPETLSSSCWYTTVRRCFGCWISWGTIVENVRKYCHVHWIHEVEECVKEKLIKKMWHTTIKKSHIPCSSFLNRYSRSSGALLW